MGFEGFLGNERVKENLKQSLSQGKISHFYLICGPAGSGKRTLARLLAAGILCGGKNRPCMTCQSCRKVLGNTHPDVITVEDPQKKTVPVDLIRSAREDLYVRPNEGSHKIYCIGQEMQIPAQNALLKVLEEPPEYGVFLLLTDNPEKLLPTVRSRCVELALSPLSEKTMRCVLEKEFTDLAGIDAAIRRSGGFLGQAKALMGSSPSAQTVQFCDAFSHRNAVSLLEVLVPMEKWKREQLLEVLNQWLEILEQALACGMPTASAIAAGRSSRELMAAIEHLQKAIEYTQSNVSPAAVCGYLEWALR